MRPIWRMASARSCICHRFVYGGLAGMRLFSVLQDDHRAHRLPPFARSRRRQCGGIVLPAILRIACALDSPFHHPGGCDAGARVRRHRTTKPCAHEPCACPRLLVPCRMPAHPSHCISKCGIRRHLQLHGELTHCYSRDSAGVGKDRAAHVVRSSHISDLNHACSIGIRGRIVRQSGVNASR